jgi:hypothetical protein
MATKNDITGDSIQTKAASDAYRDNWERIFGKKDKQEPEPEEIKPYVMPTPEKRCPQCGIEILPVMGYSCNRLKCPIFIQATC